MKKTIFFCAAAAMALASCSNDDTVEMAQKQGISFRTVVDKNTRASETTLDNLEKMYVTAYAEGSNTAYFANVAYENKKTAGSTSGYNLFESNPAYMWIPGKNIHFISVAPTAADWNGETTASGNYSSNIVFTDNKYTATFTNLVIADKFENQKDLVIGFAKGNGTDNAAGVALDLEHALSQIEIKAKNTNTAYEYKVVGVRIANAKGKGTYTYSFNTTGNKYKGEWTALDSKAVYDEEIQDKTNDAVTLNATAQSVMGKNGTAMLIPQQLTKWNVNETTNTSKGAYIALLLNVKATNGAYIYPAAGKGKYGWAAIPVETKWEAGKKYVYTLDLTNGCGKVDPETPGGDVEPGTKDPDKGKDILGGAIKFDVKVTDWTNSNLADIDMGKN